ncbi:MAG TPA: hypothetical protein VFK50_08300 [Sphingomicrobium sp.]|nr:hypothetical protein [Sphingomicrobium sp.]
MTAIWHFYWPVLVIAAVIGLVTGTVAFRRRAGRKPVTVIAAGSAAVIAMVLAWHGPGGAGRRFTLSVERSVRVVLNDYEMTQVSARLESGPATRTVILSGPADDFQQRELVRIILQIPGVSQARWDHPAARSKGL